MKKNSIWARIIQILVGSVIGIWALWLVAKGIIALINLF